MPQVLEMVAQLTTEAQVVVVVFLQMARQLLVDVMQLVAFPVIHLSMGVLEDLEIIVVASVAVPLVNGAK
jgi:hypothetical protein